MKVILMQDVAKLGRRFDIVNVPDGFGMNKLIPQGMAKPATPENVKKVQAQAASNEAERAAHDAQFNAAVEALKDQTISITVEANEDGKLFQALKADKIVEAIKAATGTTVAAAEIVIKTPIKTVGEHTIELASGMANHPLTITVEK